MAKQDVLDQPQFRTGNKECREFVALVTRMMPYCYEDGCESEEHSHGSDLHGDAPDGSWTDQQAEDAITTLNSLIAKARAIMP